ncbi:MAG TPA: tRNA (adenosine(37)-N6)-threonylcarbamoyltransferase complex ATPase subunit type 1 TsaE [Dokdonella sp.]|uniref:tRNA (adenosine(37)-N6)-threonylcarbamoyltransferase complex ATPase subunit type 1 TsaE n=1 Tax=Dokdonella sp. TaxID=2291710 RepID=UPI002D804AD5|nr:tRNA (adenosine(37)-N6)-threonylcarbamoyltransferase complex ATPase subunit type 1 TsaE [Dokdonella sp.]HET9033429.1 tRNA (adenosine(37)-N6)-threonylcarbamoyltransferase complex ATPase subunit type 1 TsaE [Dokdonella sp.]
MNSSKAWECIDEAALTQLAETLAGVIEADGVILLEGDLGAGKTTFARALLSARGVGERIKSPTYSLIESYRVDDLSMHHLDLYRIAHPDELEWLGLADLLGSSSLVLIEWPERGLGAIPPADLCIRLDHAGERRNAMMKALSARGQEWLGNLEDRFKESGNS